MVKYVVICTTLLFCYCYLFIFQIKDVFTRNNCSFLTPGYKKYSLKKRPLLWVVYIQSLTHNNNYSREHSKHGTPFDKCRRLNFGLVFELGRMSRLNNRGTGPFCNASRTLWQSSACPLPVITK